MALSAESPATWVDNLAVVVSLNTLTLFKFYPLSVRAITWFFSTWWVSNKKKNRNRWFYREDIEVIKRRKRIWAFRYHAVKSIVGINQNEILKKLKQVYVITGNISNNIWMRLWLWFDHLYFWTISERKGIFGNRLIKQIQK